MKQIQVHRITKPIQLLGAWLAGLATINISFLTASSNISSPQWIPSMLTIAAVVNVPVFIICIFLLQTKFRPEMQEDAYYSEYLNRKINNHSKIIRTTKDNEINSQIDLLANKIGEIANAKQDNLVERVKELISNERVQELVIYHGNSRTISELYIRKEHWPELIAAWKNDQGFLNEIDKLLTLGILSTNNSSIDDVSLTDIGVAVALEAEKQNRLFSQTDEDYFFGDGI